MTSYNEAVFGDTNDENYVDDDYLDYFFYKKQRRKDKISRDRYYDDEDCFDDYPDRDY